MSIARASFPRRAFTGIPKAIWGAVSETISKLIDDKQRSLKLDEIKVDVEKKHGVTINKKHFGLFLRRLGFDYNIPSKLCRKMTKKRLKRIRKYLIEYANALKLERQGDAILVYLDETYVHASHCRRRMWHKKELGQGEWRKGSSCPAHFYSTFLLHHIVPTFNP